MRGFTTRTIAVCLALLGGGCVRFSAETRRAYLDPIESVPGLAAAIAGERVLTGRWPRNREEFAAAAARTEGAKEYLARIRMIGVEEVDARQARYTFTFVGGGSSTLWVRLNLEDGRAGEPGEAR